ncbi:MAG: hypothetical protein ACJ8CH_02385 [Microvirga sp.]
MPATIGTGSGAARRSGLRRKPRRLARREPPFSGDADLDGDPAEVVVAVFADVQDRAAAGDDRRVPKARMLSSSAGAISIDGSPASTATMRVSLPSTFSEPCVW